MPATKFICPNGNQIAIKDCLKSCPNGTRCMFLPTLRAVASSVDRKLDRPTVTELISGVRETYLKKTVDYAVSPEATLYALHGQGLHGIHEEYTEGDILSEVRLEDKTTSGKFDLYGQLLGQDNGILGDLKVTSSYKLMKALGIYKEAVPTGEVYKTGARKGQPKYRHEFRYDGVHHVLEWAIQLNYYRMLLENEGFEIKQMYIQALCRDFSLRIASERGITKKLYLIPINRISDHWLKRYFAHKQKVLQQSLESRRLPKICSERERWGNRKCLDYCDVSAFCPYAVRLKDELNHQ